MGCRLWGRTESDTTEGLSSSSSSSLQMKRSAVPTNMLQIIQAKCEMSHINKIVVQSSIVIYFSPIKVNP